MKPSRKTNVLAIAVMLACGSAGVDAGPLVWSVIASNGSDIPGAAALKFNSFNQPSVNSNGLVVFRGRSKGGDESTLVHGVFQRDMSAPGSPIVKIVARGDQVPQPNNTLYNGVLSAFEEFPSTPRIDFASSMIATRGQSQPVWTFQLMDNTLVPPALTDTRIGTSGIYVNMGNALVTGASLLGSAVNLDQTTLTFPYFSVPGAPPGTRFDQFPGGPAVSDGRYISFKGNYTDPSDLIGKTGVYFRDMIAIPAASIQHVASSNTRIPNQPAAGTTKFGSTAPPSAANGYMVFTGLDIEAAPTMGGIYRAPLTPAPALQTLVGIGDQVPGEPAGAAFTAFGEGLSVSQDGRYVSFWAAWGTETFAKTLKCATDGNKDVLAYCVANSDNYLANIPVHQGIFVHDAQTGTTYPIVKTGQDGITDLIYWVYSGRPPGTGGGDETGFEPPRWRSSAFSAISGTPGSAVQTAFKATKGALSGIYLRQGLSQFVPAISVVETGTLVGQEIDAGAPANSTVTAVGIERDGFRNHNLTVAVSMLAPDPADPTVTIGWAGLYLTKAAPLQADMPVLTSVALRKSHASAGAFDLPISPGTSNATTEPRTGGTHTVVFNFDKPVISGNASVTEGVATAAATVFSGNQMLVTLENVTNRQYVTISVNGVLASGGGPAGNGTARVGFLEGDADNTGAVTIVDISGVRARTGQLTTAANFRWDVDANGAINIVDISAVRSRSGMVMP